MDISKVNAKEALVEHAVAEYEKGLGFFFSELVELNVNIYILERIAQFPFDLFVAIDDTIFWDSVIRNFFNIGVLTVTRLATDSAGDLHTLVQFKNRAREWVKPEYKSSFDEYMRQTRFDQATRELLERARHLRANRIAHVTRAWYSGEREVFQLSFVELKSLRDALNSLLNALSFNTENRLLPIPYDPQVIRGRGEDSRTDIEKILDCVARESHILNMPERYPERWKRRREKLSDEKVDQINYYRKKFGLPEV